MCFVLVCQIVPQPPPLRSAPLEDVRARGLAHDLKGREFLMGCQKSASDVRTLTTRPEGLLAVRLGGSNRACAIDVQRDWVVREPSRQCCNNVLTVLQLHTTAPS